MDLPLNANVDLVEQEGFYIFMYRDDFRYPEIPNDRKQLANVAMGPLMKHKRLQPLNPQQWSRTWKLGEDAVSRLLAHFVQFVPDFRLVDVGCKYGVASLRWHRMLRAFGSSIPIHAFDCGAAGRLARYNFVNNHADIDFQPWAVGDWDGYGLVFSEPGHPENNRIVNQLHDPWSTVSRTVRLDTFLSDKRGALVLSVDTQGAEPEVIAGFSRDRLMAGFIEFTPHAIMNRVDPVAWLCSFMQEHLVFEFSPYKPVIHEIDRNSAQAYVEHVTLRPANWTDVILLPKALPQLDAIAAQFRSFECGLGDPASHRYCASANTVAPPIGSEEYPS